MSAEPPIPAERLRSLRRQLVDYFSLEELRALALDLGVDHERFPDHGKERLARELVQHLNQTGQLPALLARLGELRPHVAWALDVTTGPVDPPYRGLDFYREEDAELFFGRAALTADLVERLRTHPLLVVVGASGSGKSSAVRAGVIPALKGRAALPEGCRTPDGSREWAYVAITPTETPLERLALALTSDLVTAGETRAIIRDLGEDPASLRLYVRKYLERLGRPRLFLLVDQFEELFTACRDEAQRRAFIAGLLAMAGNDGPATLVITLRADFYHHCAQYDGLRGAVEQHQTYIGAPGREELRAAIVEPARRRGYDLEPGLDELMLRDVGDEPGALPLLSHALLETWARRDGRTLTLAGYNDAGGARGAIARTAERVYGELNAGQRETAQRIFVELAELGEGTEDTRRRVMPDELAGHGWYAGDGAVVLERLVRARLATADDRTVQIAHEALIREWPRLREWLDADRAGERLRRGLQRAAREWNEHRRDPSYLFEGARLATAQEWAAANAERLDERAAAFVAAGVAEAERAEREVEAARQRELAQAQALTAAEARRSRVIRRAAVGLGILAVLAILAALFALNQRAEARQQASQAEMSRATAQSEATRSDLSLAMAVAAQGTAEAETDRADRNAADEAEARSTAEASAEESARQGAVANSRALSIVAREVGSDNPTLALLLAIEAGRKSDTAEAVNTLSPALTAAGIEILSLPHEGRVTQATWSADESRILTASDDGTARVWDATTGEELLTLRHEGWVSQATWNAEESRILTASHDNTARVWDATTGEQLLSLPHDGGVTQATWSADESRILTASDDNTARVWDATTGEQLLALPHDWFVTHATWNADENHILTASGDTTARVWDAATGEELLILRPHSTVTQATWSADESRILTASDDGTARVWDAATGEELLILRHEDGVIQAVWSADEKRILTASGLSIAPYRDGTARVWDATTGEELLTLRHEGWVSQATWNAEESRILTASGDGTARVWDAATGEELLILRPHSTVAQATWSTDESRILTANSNGMAQVWNAAAGNELLTLRHEDRVRLATWSADESRILTASDDGMARVWDAATGQELLALRHEGGVRLATWSADESRILTASDDGTARVWDAATGEELLIWIRPFFTKAAWSADESRILTGSLGQVAQVWDAATGELLLNLRHRGPAHQAAWSANESRILTASGDGTARVWYAATGQEILTLSHGGTVMVNEATWNANESRILTASNDGTARVWDAATGEELLALPHDAPVNKATWSADESRILTASDDGKARVWDATTGEQLLSLPHGDEVSQAAWSADESHILTVSGSTAQVWGATTGEEVFTLIGDGTEVWDARWSVDGNRILISTEGGLVSIHYTRMEDLIAAACNRLGRNMTWPEWGQYFPDEPYRQTCPNLPMHWSVPQEGE